MKLCIITKGGTHIGLGHLLRSRTFAKYCAQFAEVKIIAIMPNDLSAVFLEVREITHIVSLEQEAVVVAISYKPDVVVFDMLSFEEGFFLEIIKFAKLSVSLSPVFNLASQVNLLFTRTRYFTPLKKTVIYGGLQYSVFNSHCTRIDDNHFMKTLGRESLTIGVSMGGGDAPNKTLEVIRTLAQVRHPCMFWVLLGEGYSHSYNDLVSAIEKDTGHEIVLAKTNRSMWSILAHCSIAILAGGLTTIEAVYAGLPSINLFEKKEHLDAMAQELLDAKVCVNLGLFTPSAVSDIKNVVESLIDRKSEIKLMRENTKELVDNRGPERIFEKILYHLGGSFQARLDNDKGNGYYVLA